MGGAVYNQGSLTLDGCLAIFNQAIGAAGTSSSGGGGLGGPGNFLDGGGPNGGPGGTNGSSGGMFGGTGTSGGAGGFGGGGGRGGSGGTGTVLNGFGGNGGAGGFGGGGGSGGVGAVGTTGGSGGAGGFGGGGGASLSGAVVGSPAGFGGGVGNGLSGSGGGGGAGLGGAVFNQGGTVVVTNSTLVGNTARGGNASGTGAGSGFGGAVFNLNGSVTLTNATLAANQVAAGTTTGTPGSAAGGAVYNLAITALVAPGGASATTGTTATTRAANSILADSTGGADVVNNRQNGTATLTATGPNVVGTSVVNTGGTVTGSSFVVLDPDLGPLRNHGGYTLTMAPQPGSRVIDTGSNAAAGGRPTDQRGPGFRRLSNGSVDLGAFEVQVPVVVSPTALPDGQAGAAYAQTLTAAGPIGPFTFAVTAGALPPGLTLDPSGVLRGTPTAAGTASFTVSAENDFGETGSRPYTLAVAPAAGGGGPVGGGRRLTASGPPNGAARVFTSAGATFGGPGAALAPFGPIPTSVRTATADVDGDGTADTVLVTGPGVPIRVAVVSGADNTTVLVAPFDPFGGDFTGGGYVAAANLDGAGGAEFVVTPTRAAARASACSAATPTAARRSAPTSSASTTPTSAAAPAPPSAT